MNMGLVVDMTSFSIDSVHGSAMLCSLSSISLEVRVHATTFGITI